MTDRSTFDPWPEPRATRPQIRDDYGIPTSTEGMLPWSEVTPRLADARNYWVATVDRQNRPHALPVWGAFIDGVLVIEGSPRTARARHLIENPAVVVHLESGDQVVSVEGQATPFFPPRSFAEQLAVEAERKYGSQGYHPEPDSWDQGGLHLIRPRIVFAWTSFPADTVAFRFD